MNWLPKHKCSLHLTHNQHKDYYETLERWLDSREGTDQAEFDWVSPEEREKAIREDSVWELQWYPDTPVGSYSIAASSLEALEAYLASDEGRRDT
jgi:hypothetical protein